MSAEQSPSASNHDGDYVEALSRFFERVGGWSYDHRWLVLALSLVAWAACVYVASLARIDMTFQAFFDEKDPTFAAYLQFREDFGSDELAYILYEAPDAEHGPFDLEVMAKIARLTEALEEEVPFASEVTSLSNVEYVEAVSDGIEIYDLLEDFPESQEALLAVREKVLAKPMYVGGLVSADARHAAIIIEMEKSAVDPPDELRFDPEGGDGLENLYPQVSEAAISRILARPEYAGIHFWFAGDVPWNSAYNRTMVPETVKLMAICYLLVGLLLFLFFRRFMAVIGPFVVVSIAITAAAATVGLMGWSVDFLFPFVPTLLIAVGVADSVHIISEFNRYYAELGDRREAVRRTLYRVGAPCLLTSFTTAAGLFAMSVSHIKSVAHLASYSAVGVLTAFLLTVTLLMTLFAFGRRDFVPEGSARGRYRAREGRVFDALLTAVVRFDIRHSRSILVVSAVIFIVSFVGVSQLQVDTNFMDEWRDDAPIKRTTLRVDEVMGGSNDLVYLFDTGVPDGIKEPAVLRQIERLQSEADQHVGYVKKSYSIVDILKDINQSFHGGDPAYYVIPETRELVAQYLLVYSMSGGGDLEKYVSSDYSRANLELRCKMDAISRMAELVEELDEVLARDADAPAHAEVTGIWALWLKFAEYVTDSQVRGTLLAFAVIAAMMCFIFRSIKIGLLSMIPNISPVLLAMGYMGWVGLDLDYTRLLIAPLAIGIAVDDTIHLVTRYHVEFRRLGRYEPALRASLLGVGRALVGTTAILITGFLVNVFHSMPPQVVFGQLVALTIFVAFLADFLLMPALILVLQPFGPERPELPARGLAEAPSSL